MRHLLTNGISNLEESRSKNSTWIGKSLFCKYGSVNEIVLRKHARHLCLCGLWLKFSRDSIRSARQCPAGQGGKTRRRWSQALGENVTWFAVGWQCVLHVPHGATSSHIVPHRATCAISCYMTCPVTSSLPTEATEAMHLCRLCLCSPAKSEAVQLQKDHHEFAKEHRARRNQASPLNMT